MWIGSHAWKQIEHGPACCVYAPKEAVELKGKTSSLPQVAHDFVRFISSSNASSLQLSELSSVDLGGRD